MRTRQSLAGSALLIVSLTLISLVPASAQETSVKPGINEKFEDPSLEVKQWVERFEREGRETFDKRQQIVAACGVEPGMVVADIGAGSGLFTRMFAEKVGSDGRVFAVDIARPFVEDIQKKTREAGLENVTGVVCLPDEPNLQPESIDLAFICDTYHHFEFPYKTMASLHRSLRPGGRLVVVDFERIEGVSSDWTLGHVRAGKDVVTKEIEVSGFDIVKEEKILEKSYFVRFCKADSGTSPSDYQPVEGQLFTRWTKQVSPDNAWREYPRPQLKRESWINLNGLWDYAIRGESEDQPAEFDGKILVPYPVESALSGVKKNVGQEKRLWYRRRFTVPQDAQDEKLLLHFEAVDWRATVWVNGKQVGEHQGGYDPFSFDITAALTDAADQELVVSVWDPTDRGFQPRGKQVSEPRGIWYTSVTGIWQTVWLEIVPTTYIRSITLTPKVDSGELQVSVDVAGQSDGTKVVAESRGGEQAAKASGASDAPLCLKIEDARLWSPSDPYLYELVVRLERGDSRIDQVDSYFGMRKIEIKKDVDGFNRLFLNNQPLFQLGPLDQGWWPDGLYTAPTDAALRYDVEVTKKLGFNMIRKHVKVEPRRWYHHCDQLGIVVWQDMPNGDKHIGRDQPDLERTPESAANYYREYQALIDTHANHPCIVAWVPFNEGWGQFETNKVLAWTKKHDPTRLVDAPSGWTDRSEGDMHDIHRYPGPGMPEPEERRAGVLGEFGGLGLPVEGHLWWNKRNWGYRTYKERQELQQNYDTLMRKLRPLIGLGLAAAVYTQTTDVEGEVNGLMTYDRAQIKYDVERLASMHARLYEPPPIISRTVIVPTSEQQPQTWRHTVEQPGDGWQSEDFDDAAWKSGPGGFGSDGTPGAVVRTPWEESDIWIRRTVELKGTPFHNLHVRIHHDEDAEVFINGHKAVSLAGYTTGYEELELDATTISKLRPGKNTIAVHCHQTKGGQTIDVGLVDIEERPRE